MSRSVQLQQALQTYRYDALDRLIAVQAGQQPAARRFYTQMILCNEQLGEVERSYLRPGGELVGLRSATRLILLGATEQGSVLQVGGDVAQQTLAFTPYGQGAAPDLPGFNGEPADPLTGHYSLGNGYRVYNPTLMRFQSPDSFSPFIGGGVNPYTYCLGDPVNRVDPTGHLSWGAWLGIGLGAMGIGLGIVALGAAGIAAGSAAASAVVAGSLPTAAVTAAVVGATIAASLTIASGSAAVASGMTADSAQPSVSAALGWAALGLGVAGAAVGGVSAAIGGSLGPTVSPLAFGAMQSQGLSGKGAQAAASVWARGLGDLAQISDYATIMRSLVEHTPTDDLIALASTSSQMNQLVYQSVRPLGRELALYRGASPAANTARKRLLAIGAGVDIETRSQIYGQLPMQVLRRGLAIDDFYAPQHGETRANLQRVVDAGRKRQKALRLRWQPPWWSRFICK